MKYQFPEKLNSLFSKALKLFLYSIVFLVLFFLVLNLQKANNFELIAIDNEFEYLWELNGYSLIEPKETSLVGYIVSNAIYWIIGLSIMYLAASAFG